MERLKNVAVVVGLVLSFITLYNWGAKFFAHDVIARLEPGAFEIPPQMDSFYSNLAKSLKEDALIASARTKWWFKDAYFLKDVSEDQKERFIGNVADLLPPENHITVPYEFRQIAGYWKGTIANSSKGRITSVELYLNGARYALVKRDDNSKAAQSIENLITIGDLRPGETVEVSIWSNSPVRFLSSGDVRLTQSSGIGKVIIPRSVTGFPAWIDKYDFVFYIILWGIFAGLIVPFAGYRLERWYLRRRKA
jgi:hypothetical protein